MRLLLLLSLLGLACGINLPPSNIQDIHLKEGQSYTIRLPPVSSPRVGWYYAGGQVPCLLRQTCAILPNGDLHFNTTLTADSGLYTALVYTPEQSQVYFFNVSVEPTTIIVRVPKMEFFTLMPSSFPKLPFSFYHYEASTWVRVMHCTQMPNRVHCSIPKNECFFRKGPHAMLEGLAMNGCDGWYVLNATDYKVTFNVQMFLSSNKTEHAALGNLFFLIVDDVQGSYPFRWLKDGQEVCSAKTVADFECVSSVCDYDRFDQFSLWGTMSRDCAGLYTLVSDVGTVTYYLKLDVHTSKRVITEPGERVTLGKPDLEKSHFTWTRNGERIAFCEKLDACEWLEPYMLGKGTNLIFTANTNLAGEYHISYNNSEWEGDYSVEVKLPAPTPPPRSIIYADIPKSYRQVKHGAKVILTPPNTEYGVLWYVYAGGYEFQKVATFIPHKPVIVHHEHYGLKGNKLVIKRVTELTSGIYFAMSEQTKHIDYSLKLYAVSNTGVKSMESAAKHTQVVYNMKRSSPKNATFSLYHEHKGTLDFVQHCHVTECYSLAGPGKSFVMSPLYGECTLVAYYFQKRNGVHSDQHSAAPSRKLLAYSDFGSGSGDFADDDLDGYDVYIPQTHVHEPSVPHPADYILSYFVFLSVLLFWLLLMCMGGRLIYICCKKQRFYFPEELQLMKNP